MLCRVYSTESITYRTEDEISASILSSIEYNSDLLPNGESVNLLLGLWEDERGYLNLLALFDIVRWPSWRVSRLIFSSTQGTHTATEDTVSVSHVLYWRSVHQDSDGALWVRMVTGELHKLVRVTKENPQTYTGVRVFAPPPEQTSFDYADQTIAENTLDPADYGLTTLSVVGITRDHLLIGGDLYGTTRQAICVHLRTNGSLVRTIHLPADPVALAYSTGTVWYALLFNGAVLAFDYDDGRVLQYTQLQLGYDLATAEVKFAWSRRYRRFLIVRKTADDGTACTIRVHGYRNRTVATHVCKPIPLTPTREGRSVAFLSRRIGDAGEPIAGEIVVDASSGVTPKRTRVAVDGDGDALIHSTCDAEGAGSLDVSIEVDCTVDAPAIDNPFNTPEATP